METSALRANIPFISSTAARSDLSCRQRSRRACVLPLYQWISLGDGRISEVETAIQGISISDPLEVTRAGVDPFTVWTDQRARMLRTNLYNLLRAAGPTEIRSRCGLPAADAMAGGERRGRRTAAGHRTSRKAVQEERAQDRKAGIIWRKKAATEVMRTARHAVLLQNQKLIETETSVRHRLVKAVTPTVHAVPRQRPSTSANTSPQNQERNGMSKSTMHDADTGGGSSDLTSCRAGTRFGAVGGRQGGLRHQLRVQMNIERKRARLFEDIRMLPYTGIKGISKSATKDATEGNKSGRNTGNTQLADHPLSDARPPAIVLRASMVRTQALLHGKPAASFFARMHATGAPAVIKAALEKDTITSATVGINRTTELAPMSVAINHPELSAGKENDAGAYASSSNTSTSDRDAAGRVLHVDEPAESKSGDLVGSVNGTLIESREKSVAHHTRRRAGARGKGRQGVKVWDGWNTSTVPAGVCSLDEELVLLDGVLHNPKVRTWVETTLRPTNGRPQENLVRVVDVAQ